MKRRTRYWFLMKKHTDFCHFMEKHTEYMQTECKFFNRERLQYVSRWQWSELKEEKTSMCRQIDDRRVEARSIPLLLSFSVSIEFKWKFTWTLPIQCIPMKYSQIHSIHWFCLIDCQAIFAHHLYKSNKLHFASTFESMPLYYWYGKMEKIFPTR